MGNVVSFINFKGNSEADAYRIIKEEYEKLYVKHEPNCAYIVAMAPASVKKRK